MVLKTPTHAQQSQAKPKQITLKSATPKASQKGVGGQQAPPWGRGGSTELQEQCKQVICQIDAMAPTPSRARVLSPKQGVKESKVKPLVVSDPVTHTPLGPNFLHQAMDQCGLWLNE